MTSLRSGVKLGLMKKIIPAIIGGALLSFLGRSCVNSDWYNNITKKNINIEKVFKSNKPKECTMFFMSIQECTNFKETGKLPKRVTDKFKNTMKEKTENK